MWSSVAESSNVSVRFCPQKTNQVLNRDVRYRKFGANVAGNTRKTHVHLFLLPLLPQGNKKAPINFLQRGYSCVVPPRGYVCCPPLGMLPLLRQGTDAFSATQEVERVLVSNNIIRVDFQEMCSVSLPGTLLQFLLPQKKILPPPRLLQLPVLPLPVT